jgi:hypothetical protein
MRARRIVALALAALALILAACGGDDEETTTTNPAASEAPSQGAGPPGIGVLPPEFVECMADEGYEVQSSADIHSAPPEVLQTCFGAGH